MENTKFRKQIHVFQHSKIGDGARVVLKFWPNFRLAVLKKGVLIKKGLQYPE